MRRIIAYVICLFGSLALFYKAQLASGFTLLLSDRFDGTIQVVIQEHWFNVLSGLERWNRIAAFYPHADTLGYNDGYLIYGLVFSLFRLARIDPFLASELTTAVIRAVGFVAMQVFLRRVLALQFRWSLVGAVLFTISCNASMRANHGQLLSVGFAPLFAWLVWEAARDFQARAWPRAFAWASSAALLMGAWLLTAYYMAWFTLLFGCVFAALLAVGRWRSVVAALCVMSVRTWGMALGLAILAIPAVSPFLAVYLPISRETGMHPFAATIGYLTRPADIVHVGAGNLLWSRLDATLQGWADPAASRYSEHTTGLTPFLLLTFLLTCVRLCRRTQDYWAATVRALALATALLWLATLRIGSFEPWRFVFDAVPGAAGLRVVVRYQLFMVTPIVAVVAWQLSRLRWPAWTITALVGILMIEQVTLEQPLALNRPAEMARLAAIPRPPSGCRSFFVSRARPERVANAGVQADYSHNVDAMMLGEWFHLPTINGFNSFQPRDWAFSDPDRADYTSRVQTYALAHTLRDLCALDLTTLQWDTAPFRDKP